MADKTKLFGTDGVRGLANTYPMTAEVALRLGMATGHHFVRGKHRHKVIIGKDTRLSGYMIEPALTAGFVAMGMDVILVGPMPTPAIAMLTRSMRADIGVMISASHNAYHDNGIKIFDSNGLKLSDEVEAKIEALVNADLSDNVSKPAALGRAERLDDVRGRYIEFLKNSFPKGKTLDGLRIVIDCANGAAYNVAPDVLRELGAEVFAYGVNPNGFNINDECGSTKPELLVAKVKEHRADIGIALDGDADRLVMCDERGDLIDGDQLLALIATSWQARGRLKGDGIVATQMSNLGLKHYLKNIGLKLHRTQVGDRYVSVEMRKTGLNIGGEQSGHIILSDYTTTGDGLLAALQVLAHIVEVEQKASKATRMFEPMPQVLENVKYNAKKTSYDKMMEDSDVRDAITDAEKQLGSNGRIFIRKSGTEPLVRVMVEGTERIMVQKIANNVADAMRGVVR